jgi:mycofactocin precursor
MESITDTVPTPSTALIDDELIDDELIDDELLVEEISIDGMCGVY